MGAGKEKQKVRIDENEQDGKIPYNVHDGDNNEDDLNVKNEKKMKIKKRKR